MRSSTITVLGLRTRVLEEGNALRGHPIVLVHGVGGWAENWREAVPPLAASGRRVIAVDLPGFGESERRPRARYFDPDAPFYARFVIALLDSLGVAGAHLVGNSLGGAVCYMTAVTAPLRVRSLTLVASAGLGRDLALFLRLTTLPGMGLLALLPRPKTAAREVLRTCFFDTSRIPAALYEEAVRYGDRSFGEFLSVLRAGVDIRGVKMSLTDAWRARAPNYRGPALAVWGREDRVLPVRQVADVRDVLPQAQIRVIERCGHLPMVEQTGDFLAAVLPFLDRADEAAAA